MDRRNTLLIMIERARAHGLRVRPVSVDETGWDFRVVHAVDDDGVRWVLRAPRRPEVARLIDVEARVLEHLRPRLAVALPDWEIRAADLVAYRRLPGRPMADEDPLTLAFDWRAEPTDAFFRALGEVIAELHRTPVAEAARLGVPVSSADQQRAEVARQLREARARLPVPAHEVRRWERWLADDRFWTAETRLVHGDLHFGHTLVDGSGALVGLLDWTDAAVADPALDFAAPRLAFGPDGLDRLLGHYAEAGGTVPELFGEHIAEHTAFRSSALLGLHGLRLGNPGYVAIARARLADQDRKRSARTKSCAVHQELFRDAKNRDCR
ncbi:macrolide phosphotransferase [Saccharopolyspora erythraea NRRL 2338]|nr:macrolide phosphotransferase [Saccharopolyspora erythraea NRRL 2338]